MKLTPNRRKILEAILFLVREGERLDSPLTQYQIVKSIFLADTAHLERYGRPVTFDNYSAMQFGPVPETAYDMLKPTYNWRRILGDDGAPWERVQVSPTAFHYVRASREPDLRQLSKSDVSCLVNALGQVRELGFGGVVDRTHDHPAYREAWDRRGAAKAAPMKYEMLLPGGDAEEAEALAYASAHA